MAPIQHQVRLPLSVAMEVVLQGIQIRLGRSLVTLMGVVLGIAFLMAILTGQTIRQGVSRETQTRAELKRMINFLQAETGPLAGRTLGIVQVGALNPMEARLIAAFRKEGVERLRWVRHGEDAVPELTGVSLEDATLGTAGVGVSALLVVGDGAAPATDWEAGMAQARQPVIALSRKGHVVEGVGGVTIVTLERELRPEEEQEALEAARRAKFRTAWIIVISLLVTVIGISNAMLMSVTERFREIGTMKCLGALSAFIRRMFFIESSLIGAVGSIAGVLFGAVFSVLVFAGTYGFGLVMAALSPAGLLVYAAFSVVAGIALSVIAAIYPASFASRMVPATALRSTI